MYVGWTLQSLQAAQGPSARTHNVVLGYTETFSSGFRFVNDTLSFYECVWQAAPSMANIISQFMRHIGSDIVSFRANPRNQAANLWVLLALY